MVLQNKYKAGASRRYKIEKGLVPKPDGKTTSKHQPPVAAEDTVTDTHSEEDAAVDTIDDAEDDMPSFSRRKFMSSNSWRYEEPETDEDAEPEPEVDLTNLRAKVAALDVNTNLPGHNSDNEDDEDGDELAWAGQPTTKKQLKVLDSVDWDEMKQEKESADAARALKERFERQLKGPPNAATWRRVQGTQVSMRQRAPKQTMANTEKPSVRMADKVHGSNGTSQTVRFVPRATPTATGSAALDIDDFLESIDAADSNEFQVSTTTDSTGAPATSNNNMQDFLDEMLGS